MISNALLRRPSLRMPPAPQELVNYVTEEVEADIWGRVAAEMAGMLRRGRGLGGRDRRGRGTIARAFIDDLTRVVDSREASRNSRLD